MCSPEEARNERCCVDDVPCCYYCKHIKECYKNWKNEKSHYCKVLEDERWCSGVKRYIDKHGFGYRGRVWSVS